MHTQNTNRARVHISFICHLTFFTFTSMLCSGSIFYFFSGSAFPSMHTHIFDRNPFPIGIHFSEIPFVILHFLLSLECSARDPFSTFPQDPHFPACVLIFLIGILFPSGSIFPISHTFSTEILFPSYYIIFTPGSIFSIGFHTCPVFYGGKKTISRQWEICPRAEFVNRIPCSVWGLCLLVVIFCKRTLYKTHPFRKKRVLE